MGKIYDKAKWILPQGFAYDNGSFWAAKPLTDNSKHGFTRGTSSYRRTDCGEISPIDSSTPRIDYVNGKPRMAIDMTHSNFLKHSNGAGTNWQIQSGVTGTANHTVSPENKINATKISWTNDNQYFQYITTDFTSGRSFCFSGWFKNLSGENSVKFTLYQAGWNGVQITQSSEDVVSLSSIGSPTAYGSEYYGNGWHRVWFTLTANSATKEFNINRVSLSGSSNWAVWGLMADQGAYNNDGAALMSYIPTTTSSATVLRDFNALGTMEEEISFSEGEDFAFYWHGTAGYPGANIGDGTKVDGMLAGGGYYTGSATHKSYIWIRPGGLLRVTGDGELKMADSNTGVFVQNGSEYKIAVSRSGGVVKAFVNGSEITMNNTSDSNIGFTFRSFGWSYSSFYHHRGSVYEGIIFDQKLTNEEMQTITTL